MLTWKSSPCKVFQDPDRKFWHQASALALASRSTSSTLSFCEDSASESLSQLAPNSGLLMMFPPTYMVSLWPKERQRCVGDRHKYNRGHIVAKRKSHSSQQWSSLQGDFLSFLTPVTEQTNKYVLRTKLETWFQTMLILLLQIMNFSHWNIWQWTNEGKQLAEGKEGFYFIRLRPHQCDWPERMRRKQSNPGRYPSTPVDKWQPSASEGQDKPN